MLLLPRSNIAISMFREHYSIRTRNIDIVGFTGHKSKPTYELIFLDVYIKKKLSLP